MISVETYSDLRAVDSLCERWDRLWSLTPDASFSQTHDYFRSAVEVAGVTPRVFAASVSGRLIGLWPMFSRSVRTPFGLRSVLSSRSTCHPSGCFVGPSPAATAAIVARHLRTTRDWRSITFIEPLSTGGTCGTAAAAFAAAGLLPAIAPAEPIAEVRLEGRWSDVLDRCDEETRLAIYRMQHYANDDYRFERIRVTSAGTPRELDAALSACRAAMPATERALSTMTVAVSRRGSCDVALLRFRGRVVAASFGFVNAAGLENMLTAVAPGAPSVAGVRLLFDLFRDGLARGDRRVLFVAPPGHPAIGWARCLTPCSTVRVETGGGYAASIRRIGNALHCARRRPRSVGIL